MKASKFSDAQKDVHHQAGQWGMPVGRSAAGLVSARHSILTGMGNTMGRCRRRRDLLSNSKTRTASSGSSSSTSRAVGRYYGMSSAESSGRLSATAIPADAPGNDLAIYPTAYENLRGRRCVSFKRYPN